MQIQREVIFFEVNGKNYLRDWLSQQSKNVGLRVTLRLQRLQDGYYGDYKSLGGGLYELRFFFGKGYRIYFTETTDILGNNKIIILLCGGDKDTQSKDIKKANMLLNKVKQYYGKI